jgi:DNA polymerase-1
MIPDDASSGGEAGRSFETLVVSRAALPLEVALRETARPRWVWDDTTSWYPALLAAGVRVERCTDLRLTHSILRRSEATAGSEFARAPRNAWDVEAAPPPRVREGTLFDFGFDLDEVAVGDPTPHTDSVAEFLAQRRAIAATAEPGRIGLLLAAESAGAVIACEMKFAGLPWHAPVHDALLTDLLGARPVGSERPEKLERLRQQIGVALDQSTVNPDSPTELLKALGRAGIVATSTRSWELKQIEHPVIEPLLAYKKLARLASANGWSWLETWVADGRFRPEYSPGAAATGRWGASGGGALQLPKQIRGAVIADPGWAFVVADAAQLEPRILSALSADRQMAHAGRGDLYEGIVASGAVATRAEAKLALLGAMYGATSGESGRLLPALTKAFPSAIAMVEAAARAGERGEKVSTRLGRSSPLPGDDWAGGVGESFGEGAAGQAEQKRARNHARAWGRFTRNFIVQGTAAEWALCWMAGLRTALWEFPTRRDGGSGGAGGAGGAGLANDFVGRPHLVFFLHDEIIVHTPLEHVDAVLAAVRQSAADAGRLIFGQIPVDFPVTAVAVDCYSDAK